jgi:predicted transcriptional regulator
MSAVKEQVIEVVKNLPDNNITLENVIEELYFKLQVDQGLAELDAGKGIPHSEVKARMSKWLKE